MKLWGGVAESAEDRRLLLVIAASAEQAMDLVGDALTHNSAVHVEIGEEPICDMPPQATARVFCEVSLPVG